MRQYTTQPTWPLNLISQVDAYGMHHNPKYWDHPEDYLPERFIEGTPEYARVANRNAWLPFGGGQRACPGEKFALQQSKIALISLYQRFTLELQEGQVCIYVYVSYSVWLKSNSNKFKARSLTPNTA